MISSPLFSMPECLNVVRRNCKIVLKVLKALLAWLLSEHVGGLTYKKLILIIMKWWRWEQIKVQYIELVLLQKEEGNLIITALFFNAFSILPFLSLFGAAWKTNDFSFIKQQNVLSLQWKLHSATRDLPAYLLVMNNGYVRTEGNG